MVAFLEAVDGRIPNFAGIKYTFESLYEYNQCRLYKNGKFDMLHGQDETILPCLAMGGAQGGMFWGMAAVMAAAALVRFLCTKGAARAAFYASKEVKKALRGLIYRKLLRLGAAYTQNVPTAEVVQLAGEGTEQLETYFGAYLPQLFYSMLAPVTLFAALCTVSVRAAVVLMVCVPLIPFSIMAVQKFAKRLLGKYWGQYACLLYTSDAADE